MKVFKSEEHQSCSNIEPFISIAEFPEYDKKLLQINDDVKNEYLSWWQNEFKVGEILNS